MEIGTMGKVVVSAMIENISDSLAAQAGTLGADQVRKVEVNDAVVDTGAKLLGMPKRLIQQLGLIQFETRPATTTAGIIQCPIYRAVWLTVEGRRCTVDVAEVDDRCPVVIGYVPLELLDLTVDPVNQRLVPCTQEGGQRLLDLL